ncbi:cytochrome c biogenesis protein CcsA [Marixanthomonas sp. SCSIO 43207]|uniref:cytochrome c biogenesis protein n=1 Tax=Marixanthomonas sp. SCSIO 43207 TaxID=2779360 RepID=UPI001CA850BC|nr:cytochrome c biogenesis protein CcsA [Marixanthomonas sp. SCSIO 43207]UAB80795.1 cytochrome c biogenesis protein CcsA [Marixanthomonas sp. SCSIO 43207]
MIKRIASILFSTRLTAVLFIVFAVAMGIGTFLDASSETSPTPYSREMIYNAWWFEAIMGIFVLNFLGNISRYNLNTKKMWATFILHISFILIIIGAFVTRYIGYEGVMHIREGETENVILSEHTYLNTFIDGDYMVNGVAQRRKLPPKKLRLSERLDNDFTIETDYNEQPVTIKYKDFIKNAKEGLIETEDGSQFLKIVEAGDGNRHDHWLEVGEVASIHNVLFAVNKPTEGAINITYNEDGSYDIESPFEGSYMRMADQKQGSVAKDSLQPLMLRSLYQLAGMAFVIPEPMTTGKNGVVKADAGEKTNKDALILDVTSNGETKTIELLGGKGTASNPKKVTVGGLDVYLTYGSKSYELPFSVTLNDFIAEKYPGTEKNYASFESKVTVNKEDGSTMDYRIYMNHVLDYGGYRFFQSGFDPDEGGTILSVNHDFWGTWITYIGYFLLYIGLMAILFDKNTRFGFLERALTKIKKKKAKMAMLVLVLLSATGFAQQTPTEPMHMHSETPEARLDSVIKTTAVSKEHAAKFSRLVIQDNGRMKPVHTFASQLLRKISKDDSYRGLDANQVFLSMTEFPRLWLETPLLKLDWRNDSIKRVIGVSKETSEVSLIQLFDENGNSKIAPYIEEATSKTNPNQFEKDFIKIYEKTFLLNRALSGSILKIFPLPNDENNTWVSYPELQKANFKGTDSVITKSILPVYFQTLKKARQTGDYAQAEQILEGINKFQHKYGSEVMPSDSKIDAEIAYNKADIFNRLYKYFALIGIVMFIVIIFQIFKEGKTVNTLIKVCKYIIWVFFALMTLGLIARWYISGHAPWSDAYESIIYIAWATVFFGLAFGRKSDLTIASTAFVASIILWVAHQNWLDPAISTLVPVLDSYWLMIHVAVIVASYGPFTLGMILGATALLLMILTNDKNKKKMDINIKEITIITEMALTVGLVMLTIGNFLGGQWANESWGRYWGWDPKETWALISIMIYAFVIHARLVPGLKGRWLFNVLAIFSYATIMMTYFGVNFYLTGLHSYASGDVPVTPTFVYYLIAFFVILTFVSYFSYEKHYKNKKRIRK